MIKNGNKGFTRLEVVLGLCVTAAVVLVTVPSLWRGNGQDRQRNAMSRAEEIAAAVLDYRCDTGRWPGMSDGRLDVSCLTEAPGHGVGEPARARAAGGFTIESPDSDRVRTRPWLDEIPLDPWGRPYHVHLVGGAVAAAVTSDAAGYPAAPPEGLAILVISSGPDGIFQTDPRDDAAGFAGDDIGCRLVNPTDPAP